MGAFYSYNPYIDCYENYLAHYGIKRKSGRYPFGSGKRPHQHEGRKEGLATTAVAVGVGALATAALNRRSEKKKADKLIQENNERSKSYTDDVLTKIPNSTIDGNYVKIKTKNGDKVSFGIETYEEISNKEKFISNVNNIVKKYDKIKKEGTKIIEEALKLNDINEYKLTEPYVVVLDSDRSSYSMICDAGPGIWEFYPSAYFNNETLKFDPSVGFDD